MCQYVVNLDLVKHSECIANHWEVSGRYSEPKELVIAIYIGLAYWLLQNMENIILRYHYMNM